MAAAPAVSTPVGVTCRSLAVFGPSAEDLVRAVVTTATGHTRRSLVDLKPEGEGREAVVCQEL